MLRRTLTATIFSFLALAGNLAASAEATAPTAHENLAVFGSDRAAAENILGQGARTLSSSELPDAPSAVASLEMTADEKPLALGVLESQPEIGTEMALEMPPAIEPAAQGGAGFEGDATHLPQAELQPGADPGFHLFLRRSSSPSTFATAFFDAAMAQHKNDWPGYGRGIEGFSKRYGALMADRTTSRFFSGYLMPTLLHQDPRYRRLGPQTSVWKRMEYSISRVVLTRNLAGHDTLNSSLLLNTLLSKSVQNLYYPRQQRGFEVTLRRTEKSLRGQLQANLEAEFLPDIESFIWRHLPARIKRLEKRLPFSREWEPASFS